MPHSLHILDSYLPRTETFIWQALRQLRRFPPLVMADALENLDAFPLPGGAFTDFAPVRSLPSKAWARLSGSFAPVHYPGAAAALRERDIAVTHVHKGFRAVVTRGFTRELGKPLLVSFYGSDVSQKAFLRRARGGYRELFAQARFLLAEGPVLRRRLIDLGARPEKVHIQRIAIDPSDYFFRERSWDGERPVRFLFIGRLVEKKGLETGLRALADKRIDFPWELTVIGDGPLRASLGALAARLGIRERVDFAGYKSLDEMRAALQSHDLLLQPSRVARDGDAEGGAPTVLLEAQACGLPVLSTTHADIPFVTVPGESSWLAPEGDAGALAGLILRAAEGAARWGEMGRAGRAKVAADHDVNREILRLEELYAEAAG